MWEYRTSKAPMAIRGGMTVFVLLSLTCFGATESVWAVGKHIIRFGPGFAGGFGGSTNNPTSSILLDEIDLGDDMFQRTVQNVSIDGDLDNEILPSLSYEFMVKEKLGLEFTYYESTFETTVDSTTRELLVELAPEPFFGTRVISSEVIDASSSSRSLSLDTFFVALNVHTARKRSDWYVGGIVAYTPDESVEIDTTTVKSKKFDAGVNLGVDIPIRKSEWMFSSALRFMLLGLLDAKVEVEDPRFNFFFDDISSVQYFVHVGFGRRF